MMKVMTTAQAKTATATRAAAGPTAAAATPRSSFGKEIIASGAQFKPARTEQPIFEQRRHGRLGHPPGRTQTRPGRFSPGALRPFEAQETPRFSRTRVPPSQKEVISKYFRSKMTHGNQDASCRSARPSAAPNIQRLLGRLGKVILGKERLDPRCATGILAGGHVLLEGLPGLGKTALVKGLRAPVQRPVQARAVHARPDAQRHPRHAHPAGDDGRRREIDLPAGAGLHQHPAGRRDQPRLAQDPVGAAGGDAGALGDAAGRDAHAARAVLRAGHARTRSSWRAPIRCPRPSSTASCSSCTWTAPAEEMPERDHSQPRGRRAAGAGAGDHSDESAGCDRTGRRSISIRSGGGLHLAAGGSRAIRTARPGAGSGEKICAVWRQPARGHLAGGRGARQALILGRVQAGFDSVQGTFSGSDESPDHSGLFGEDRRRDVQQVHGRHHAVDR